MSKSKTSKNKAWHKTIAMPAPGNLLILQELLNTAPSVKRVEGLAKPSELADWLVTRGLLTSGLELSEEDRVRVLHLRYGLRWSLRGRRLSKEGLKTLNHSIEGARLELRFSADGEPRVVPTSGQLDDVIAHLVGIVLSAHLSGEWSRLVACSDRECDTVFWDDSLRRVRLWCTKRCGDRIRARAYRKTEVYRGNQDRVWVKKKYGGGWPR